jgi:hypothetical protein
MLSPEPLTTKICRGHLERNVVRGYEGERQSRPKPLGSSYGKLVKVQGVIPLDIENCVEETNRL